MTTPGVTFPMLRAPATRRRSLAPWWVALIVLGVGVFLGLIWFVLGGLPFSNHAAYGRVDVPGSGAVTLPTGIVWLHFEEDGVFGENDSADMPSDLQVSVAGQAGGLEVERLSDMLFSVSTNNTGHVPYGRLEIANAGSYQVSTMGSPTSAVAPRVTFGEPPWNPFGAPIVGSLVILVPFALVALVMILPLRRR